ncbi:MAG TPA: hypothetical protein DEQ55_11180, partial [Pseudomonas sp.]|nr:hypothetical protein [Pseudomonas sp.]
HAVIETRVADGEVPRLTLRIKPGEPVRLRDITLQVNGPAAELQAFRVPRNTLKPGAVLNHGQYEAVKQRILNQASRYGFFDGRFERQRLAINPDTNAADVELAFNSGPRDVL